MTRALRIAAREYMAFVRTVGFWLSICLMPLGLTAVMFFSGVAARTAPTPSLAILDLTGGGYAAPLASAAGEGKPPAAIVAAPPPGLTGPGDLGARVRPYLAGDLTTPDGHRLDAVAIVRGTADKPALDVWTRNINEPGLQATLGAALTDALRRADLARAGLSPAAIAALDAAAPKVTQFSPRSAGGAVSLRDRLPGIAGFAMGIMLWSLILTGAGILLNSVIEEKQNRILEVLLTSASAPEIMTGKILGAAGITATALMVWLTVASFAFGSRNPEILAGVAALLFGKGLIVYFLLYFVGGYLMYAALFTTIGAFCETPREAQTLLGPLMILLTIPLVFMGQAISRPDAPVLQLLSWIPPFTPFLMAARAASDPPLWQVAGTATLMFATTAVELWVAGRAFRTGALASGRFDLRLLVAGVLGRGERA
ncbi:MAG TPA: ABC transporter permease [Caulobacteraceae bacterium]|nr:ABC transporter permease [Caulobacteraceae bacterium]